MGSFGPDVVRATGYLHARSTLTGSCRGPAGLPPPFSDTQTSSCVIVWPFQSSTNPTNRVPLSTKKYAPHDRLAFPARSRLAARSTPGSSMEEQAAAAEQRPLALGCLPVEPVKTTKRCQVCGCDLSTVEAAFFRVRGGRPPGAGGRFCTTPGRGCSGYRRCGSPLVLRDPTLSASQPPGHTFP